MTRADGTLGDTSCPSCGGRVYLIPPPKQASDADIRAWASALRAREGRLRGVSDGLSYETRRAAQSRAAWYRRKLVERGLETDSVTRPKYCCAAHSWRWTLVLWKKGSRPVSAVEAVMRAHEQSKADRAAESIKRGSW